MDEARLHPALRPDPERVVAGPIRRVGRVLAERPDPDQREPVVGRGLERRLHLLALPPPVHHRHVGADDVEGLPVDGEARAVGGHERAISNGRRRLRERGRGEQQREQRSEPKHVARERVVTAGRLASVPLS